MIKPLNNRVLVLPDEAETKTASGIIIPETAKEKPGKGTVIVTAKGTEEVPMDVNPGDRVMYGKYAGSEVELEGKTYLMVRQDDIIGILD